MTFATKLLLALSGTAVIGVAVLTPIAATRTAGLLERQLVARLDDNARQLLERLDLAFRERLRASRSLTSDPAFLRAADSPEPTARHLRTYLAWHREYRSAAFYTAGGEIVADTAGPTPGVTEDLGGCRAELAAGAEVAICVGRGSPPGGAVVRLAIVARDRGASRGVLVLRLPLSVFADQLRDAFGPRPPGETPRVELVDDEGATLYSSRAPAGELLATSPDWAAVREAVRAGRDSGSLRRASRAGQPGDEVLAYVRGRGSPDFPGRRWTLLLAVPAEIIFAPVRALRLEIAAAILLVGAGLLAILLVLVRSFARPIDALGRAAREIATGNLDVRVPDGSRDELGLFAAAFNRMAANVQESHLELAAARRELEGLVEERTRELFRTNELLHAELSERVKAQEALAARERLLRLNADIGEALTSGHTLEGVLQRCAESIARDLDAVLVRLWTLGDEPGVLVLKASAGMSTRLDGPHGRKIVGQSKIGIIAQQQRPLLTNAVVGDPAFADQEWALREGIAAFAGHPLVIDGRTVGVMALFSRRPLEPFVLTALETVADKIATFVGRKQAEEALRVSEQRHRELFDTSRDGIYRTDAAGVFTSINPAGARIFGYDTPAEILGRKSADFWMDPAEREAFLETLRREKSVSAHPIHARKRDGTVVELEASSRILEGESGGFLGIEGALRDVTQRVKFEAERDLLLAQLQEAAANIRTLSGLLPICSACKKIRNEQGRWSPVEAYVSAHTEAEFTHGMCPDCVKVYFPSFSGKSPDDTT